MCPCFSPSDGLGASTKLSTADSNDPTGSRDDQTRLCSLSPIDRLPLIQIKRRTPERRVSRLRPGWRRPRCTRPIRGNACSLCDGPQCFSGKLGTGLVERRDTVAVARYPGQAILLAGAWFGDAKDY